MKYIFLTLWIATFSTGIGSAQQIEQTIRGTVIDQVSRFPLPGASVIILESDPLIGAITDPSGKFRLENIPVGRYDIQVSFIGYDPYIIRELLVGSSKEAVLEIFT